MDKNGNLTDHEIHELSLIYAQEKLSQYLRRNVEKYDDDQNRELNFLLNAYKQAMEQMKNAEITEYL